MKRLLYILAFLSVYVNIWGQEVLKTSEQVNGFKGISQERVFLHLNTSTLLTGEYLYYKAYCFNVNKGSLSNLSKVAYVELVGKEGNQIFKHKILLEGGQGYGDFFIPTSVASGNYKLLGYTNWMRNGQLSDFFQLDITIINPYQSDQAAIQVASSDKTDSIPTEKMDKPFKLIRTETIESAFGPIEFFLQESAFKKRSKVSFILKAKNKLADISGNYSISVRQKDIFFKGIEPQNSYDFVTNEIQNQKGYQSNKNQVVYLPELRGELFCGKVIAVNNAIRVSNLKIAISLPGEQSYFDVVISDDFGNFCFNIKENYSNENMYLQVLSDTSESYRVTLNKTEPLAYSSLKFNDIDLTSSNNEEVLRRSVHNQIESSYFQFKPDSVVTKPFAELSKGKESNEFILNDFTRFKTVKETIVEIIKNVSTERVAKDNFVIKVKGFDYATRSELLPLLLIDGYMVQDHNALLQFDARSIEKITVMRHKLVFGPKVFLGVIILKTKNGNGYEMLSNGTSNSVAVISKPYQNKNYFVQKYDEGTVSSRLPDDRIQLYWKPNQELESSRQEVHFFTSDVTGEFEIQIEGFTANNIPISIRKSFFVE